MKIRLERDRFSGDWLAYLDGKSSPIVQPVPGNTRPAARWRFSSVDDAAARLREHFGADVEIVSPAITEVTAENVTDEDVRALLRPNPRLVGDTTRTACFVVLGSGLHTPIDALMEAKRTCAAAINARRGGK